MRRSERKRVSRDQRRFQLYPINYGSVNRPDSQRGRRGHSRGGFPPSHPCPPNVDPETGEIVERPLDRFCNSIGFGEPMPGGLRHWSRQHPSIYGRGHLRRAGLPAVQKEGRKVGRLVVAGILAAAIAWGTVTYINTPHGRYDYPGGEQQRIEDANRANQWEQEHPYWQFED